MTESTCDSSTRGMIMPSFHSCRITTLIPPEPTVTLPTDGKRYMLAYIVCSKCGAYLVPTHPRVFQPTSSELSQAQASLLASSPSRNILAPTPRPHPNTLNPLTNTLDGSTRIDHRGNAGRAIHRTSALQPALHCLYYRDREMRAASWAGASSSLVQQKGGRTK